jgi:hypothetical protein
MENQEKNAAVTPEEPREETQEVVSRRRLLKSLAVSGGAAAGLAMLPGKWTRPVVEAGELAAHADASPAATLRIGDVNFGCEFLIFGCSGSLCYDDPLGEVSKEDARLEGSLEIKMIDCPDTDAASGCGGPKLVITEIQGTGYEGCLDFEIEWGCTDEDFASRCRQIQIVGCIWMVVDGRESNKECKTWTLGGS